MDAIENDEDGNESDAVITKEVSENANDAIENDEDWNESDLYQ